jgi:transposase InsO family protein
MHVKRFLWDHIVYRFGFPLYLVRDNGKQFCHNPVKDWCLHLNITQVFTSVAHPQGNDQVERANRSIVHGIKTRLSTFRGCWVEEVPYVLWAHRTMTKTSTGETPFSLNYGTKAIIPAEIGLPLRRTQAPDVTSNDQELWLNLELLEERREMAAIRKPSTKGHLTSITMPKSGHKPSR